MSKLDFVTSSTNFLSTLALSIQDREPQTARRLNDIVASATNPFSDGFWNRIEPHYGSPAYMLAKQDLDNRILAGENVTDFQDYVAKLVEELAGKVAA